MYCLSACTFQQVVDTGNDEQFVAVLFQVDKTLVGIDHLLQVFSTMCVKESSA